MPMRRTLLATPLLLAAPALAQTGGQATACGDALFAGWQHGRAGPHPHQGLGERLGGTFVMEHRPGATTSLGAATSPPRGRTG
jgi:hypothetical protein